MRKQISPIEAPRELAAPLAPPPNAQKLITPDCPRCGAVLWGAPCDVCAPRVHYWCESCQVEFVFSEPFEEWLRFGVDGQVAEIIPPRIVGTLPGRKGGEYITQGNQKRFVRAEKKEAAAARKVAREAAAE